MPVAPYVGAWIETVILRIIIIRKRSHPTWVRGLKLMFLVLKVLKLRSHPTWVRGLKLMTLLPRNLLMTVAPYVGAWIETYM